MPAVPGPGVVLALMPPGTVAASLFAPGGSTLRPAPGPRAALLLAGLVPVLVPGCENHTIPLADVPRAAQPDPVPIEKLPKEDRPRVDASARAALRFDPAKQHGGPPR